MEKGKKIPKKIFTKSYVIMSISLLFIGGTGSNRENICIIRLSFRFCFALGGALNIKESRRSA